jgi:ATP-binding cassette subfamily F protein 3
MVKLLLQPVNLLVLDEPTNHLDIRSKEILKQALIAYDGTMVIVSHDREFLNGLVNKVYEFRNHRTRQHIGGIYEFLEKRKIENLAELEKKTKQSSSTAIKEEPISKAGYLEKKELDKVIRKVSQQIAVSEDKISKFEDELAAITQQLSEPDKIEPGKSENLFIRHGEVEKLIEMEMAYWENLHADLEKLKNQRF